MYQMLFLSFGFEEQVHSVNMFMRFLYDFHLN